MKEAPSASLDGLTLFRFAHMWRHASSGGVEGYLWNLNRVLLERNNMRILQMYLVREGESFRIEIEKVGRGELVWIPSIFRTSSGGQLGIARRFCAKFSGRQGFEFAVNHDILLSTLASYQTSLGVFHWISEDSGPVIDYFHAGDIPFVVVHHFQNARLKRRMVRNQISKAVAVAGVTGTDVPDFIRGRFANLSDAVDTEFFCPDKALPLENKVERPMILLPSRVYQEKGHLDAARAMVWLARTGVKVVLAFVGRVENQSFIEKLMQVASDEGLQERVFLVGEVRPEELRDWYAASDLVVLPSYSEGLPRVLLEAQAMERPVVAYAVGGVAEAIQDRETGFLVRVGDFQGLAIRLSELLADEAKRREMGERGRNFIIRNFSLNSLALRHEGFYAKAIS